MAHYDSTLDGPPHTARPRTLLAVAGGIALGAFLCAHVHVYGVNGGTFNSGAYVDLPHALARLGLPSHACGIEWRGTPGGFCDVDW